MLQAFIFKNLNNLTEFLLKCNPLKAMDNLQPERYETILKYMQAANVEDFEQAKNELANYEFNIETALNARFNNNQNRHQVQQVEQDQQNNQNVRKYIQYLYRKNQNYSLLSSIFSFFGSIFKGFFVFLARIIFPEFLKRFTINTLFANLYKYRTPVKTNNDSLKAALSNARLVYKKPCFLVISSKQVNNCLLQFLNQRDISNHINALYYFVGLVQGQKDWEKFQGDKAAPMIVILRENICQEIEILQRIPGQQNINSITTEQLLKWVEKEREFQRKERNTLIRYRNMIRRRQLGQYAVFYEQDEQEVPVLRRHRAEERTQATQMISQQNGLYKKMEQQARIKKQKQIQQQRKRQQEEKKLIQIVQQRKIRKMSIPDEPIEGDIIRFHFRCPNGQVKIRNFEAQQKIQLIFNWVETNQQIVLEDEKRRFELFYSYPPTPLSDKMDKPLKQIFETDQQKIMIRQL